MKHSVYSEILASMGWFDTGMDKPEPFFADYRVLHPQPRVAGEILPSTLIAYYPGCFAEFHNGHKAVIRETADPQVKADAVQRLMLRRLALSANENLDTVFAALAA